MRTPDPTTFLEHFTSIVLGHAEKEYPNKLDHVMNDAGEVRSPRELHPIFYGSYDWHSSVHGHWLLVRALRLMPSLFTQAPAVASLLDRNFTADKVAGEVAYLRQKSRGTFERTYGWAWLLKLGAELHLACREKSASDPLGAAMVRWRDALQPLVDAFAVLYVNFLPKATYPVRVGTHNNAAFGLSLAVDYATIAGHASLRAMIVDKAKAWYGRDVNCPAWEPDGTDFISPALMESECMRRVLEPTEFLAWFDAFLPDLAAGKPATLFTPATVSDRADAQITHLDGLNLCRAWCWRSIGKALPEADPRRALASKAFTDHLDAALAHVTGDYVGEHWLATFALLAVSE
ncbi:MAG: DUF2891 domain-containing protein [Phycisphaerae bacterium]